MALPGPLPAGWYAVEGKEAKGLVHALGSEMAPSHPLAGVPLEAVARAGGCDDVLYRHLEAPERYAVVHLTWTGRRERTPDFPSIEFEGSFEAFAGREEEILAQARNSRG